MSLEEDDSVSVLNSNEITKYLKSNATSSNLNFSLTQSSNGSLIERDSLYIIVPITVIYLIIFVTGIIGNVSTCIVIARNKSMHTATNYYLFSLAISDLLLLVSGLPPEIYRMWSPWIYIFGETFCFFQGLAAETSVNASVFTITAFTVERYVAICHPFLSHTMSKLPRAIKFVFGIWILALCLALPQALQFSVRYEKYNTNGELIQSRCTITKILTPHVFEISTFLIFVFPMTIIMILYLLIGVKLRRSRILVIKQPQMRENNLSIRSNDETRMTTTPGGLPKNRNSRTHSAQNHVIKMLVAVVVAFFICWAPFHAQRLLAVYISATIAEKKKPGKFLTITYQILHYISGILYFMSTTINPLLYNIMSNKFRDAFKNTFIQLCYKGNHPERHLSRQSTYSTLYRYQLSLRSRQRQLQLNTPEDRSAQSEPVLQRFNSINMQEPHPPENTPESSRSHLDSMSCKEILPLQLQTLPTSASNTHQRKFIYNNPNKDVAKNTKEDSEILHQTPVTTIVHKIAQKDSNKNDSTVITEFNKSFENVVNKKPIKYTGKPRFNSIQLATIAYRLRSMFQTHLFEYEHSLNIPPRYLRGRESLNTVSNSSLQDLDELEFSSIDLAKYMGELNENIMALR